MNLIQKMNKAFDTYIPEGSSNKAAVHELGRRGKLTIKALTELVVMLADEIEELKPKAKK